jgi:hypothetical protein
MEQAAATREKLTYFLNKANVKAPFSGVIVEGSKEELLGTPVNKGDLLFKIARPEDMYLKLFVSEKDIDEVSDESMGELALLSNPDKKFKFQITKIVPMAHVDAKNGNVFMIRAKILDRPEDWWRPGMSGVAKINVGPRRISWVLTHRIQSFLQLYFWL